MTHLLFFISRKGLDFRTICLIAMIISSLYGWTQNFTDTLGLDAVNRPKLDTCIYKKTFSCDQPYHCDSTHAAPLHEMKWKKPYYTVKKDMTYVGIPLLLVGVIGKNEKKRIFSIHHDFAENFHSPADDYTQFATFALSSGLKLAGVKGRSNWYRYAVSSALAYGIMAACVNSLKYSVKELRPDKSSRNSFPSGHTATAFASATILHKEYGMTRSPWYSVAGYGIATATGIMRVLNNRHWVSDVIAGAGIGILSTELAYAAGDLIFKHRGITKYDRTQDIDLRKDPSFFSIQMGVELGGQSLKMPKEFAKYSSNNNPTLKFCTASMVGVECAYFINRYMGFGGNLQTSSNPMGGIDGLQIYQLDSQTYLKDLTFIIDKKNLTELTAKGGLFLSFPFSARCAVGTKFLLGESNVKGLSVKAKKAGTVKNKDLTDTKTPYETIWEYFSIKGNRTLCFSTGLSFAIVYKSSYCLKTFVDWNMAKKTFLAKFDPLKWKQAEYPGLYQNQDFSVEGTVKKTLSRVSIGGSFSVSF